MKRTCSRRKQLDGTKPVESKDRVYDYESCESEERLQRPIILYTKRKALLRKNHAKTYMYTATKTPTKKAQPNFLQTTRKLGIILTLFITVLTIS